MPEQRLLKLNEQGFQKRKQLLDQQTKKNRPASAPSPPSTAGTSGKGKDKGKKGENSKKRGRETGVDTVSESRPTVHNSFCLAQMFSDLAFSLQELAAVFGLDFSADR